LEDINKKIDQIVNLQFHSW